MEIDSNQNSNFSMDGKDRFWKIILINILIEVIGMFLFSIAFLIVSRVYLAFLVCTSIYFFYKKNNRYAIAFLISAIPILYFLWIAGTVFSVLSGIKG